MTPKLIGEVRFMLSIRFPNIERIEIMYGSRIMLEALYLADPGDDDRPMAPDALISALRVHVLFPQLSQHTRGTLSGMAMLAREIVFGANTQRSALTAAERVEHERLLTDMEVHYMDGKKLLFSCPELARLSPLQMAILRHIIEVKFSRV